QVRETDISQIIIPCFTIRISNFEHINPANVFQQRFFTNIPSTGNGRKESEAVIFMKILGTGITKIEINIITRFKIVIHASGYTLISAGDAVFQVATDILGKYLG